MKKKLKITFEISANYSTVEKPTKELSKQFEKWFIDYVKGMSDETQVDLIPTLFEKNNKDRYNPFWHQPSGSVSVKITSDNQEIFATWWDQLSDDF